MRIKYICFGCRHLNVLKTWEGIYIYIFKNACAIVKNILFLTSSFYRLIPAILLIILASPMAICADTNASLLNGTDLVSDAHAMQVLIIPSSDQAASGDVLGMTYLVLNNGNSTMMNVSLLTQEMGPVDLNVSILLPGQAAAGNESIIVGDGNLPGPIIRTAKAKADNSLGENVNGENSTSIVLLTKGTYK